MSKRYAELSEWLGNVLKETPVAIAPASADASFRRYFRVYLPNSTLIVMDAPPEKEDCRPFVDLAGAFRAGGLNVPEVLAADFDRGFLLLTDLGSDLYLAKLNAGSVKRLYGDALGALITLQVCGPHTVPAYDAKLLDFELSLFRDWFIVRHLGLPLEASTATLLAETFSSLTTSALEQPAVCVHRDYHSRNLMVTPRNNPGILDFQDAVWGPITYDLVSLLRDCYISWPAAQIREWALGYHELALDSGILSQNNPAQFLYWFDLMGMQRHLKAIGIFSRLYHRDGKSGYLGDIPRTLNYVSEIAAHYPIFSDFHAWLRAVVIPRIFS